MDAGLLHHAAHAHAFESSQESFFLEENAIALCTPLDATVAASTRSAHRHRAGSSRRGGMGPTSPSAASTTTKPESSESLLGTTNGLCACRQLSQRVVAPKRSKRRHRPFQRSRSQRAKSDRSRFFTLRKGRRSDDNVLVVSSPGDDQHTSVGTDDFGDFVDEIPRLSDVHETTGSDDDDDHLCVRVE